MTVDRDFSDILVPFDGGVRLTVRAKPGISRKRSIKIVDIGEGKRAFEISVSAPAQDGKANEAICAAVSEWLGVSKRSVAIKTGASSKIKIVELAGDNGLLTQQLVQKINPTA